MNHQDRQRVYKIAIWLTKVMPVAISLVHEAKHVQSHICKYYHVEEDSEQAAYLIGYIVQKMHDFFRYQISTGRE